MSGTEPEMRWYTYVAYFFGGAFLANTVPHFGDGISEHVKVVWGLTSLLIGYLLLSRVGRFDPRRGRHVLAAGSGMFLMALVLAQPFARIVVPT